MLPDELHQSKPQQETAPRREPGAEACPRCGVIDKPTLMAGSGPHACKAVCSHCGRFLRWISLLAPAERLAHRRQAMLKNMLRHPPSQAQLDFLKTLGDQDVPPGDMAEASERIEALKVKQAKKRAPSGR